MTSLEWFLRRVELEEGIDVAAGLPPPENSPYGRPLTPEVFKSLFTLMLLEELRRVLKD